MTKRYTIIANWKMNPGTKQEALRLFKNVLKEKALLRKIHIIVCPPFLYISLLSLNKGKNMVSIGVQNISRLAEGPHTGEVSGSMIKSAGATHAIIGHSERRAMGETDEVIGEKMRQAMKSNLYAILAVGESEPGEDAHRILEEELKKALSGVSLADMKRVLIAYEPRWAISKGKDDTGANSDTPEHAFEKAIFIRRILANLYNSSIAQKTPVLYGGSVRSKNISVFVNADSPFDGALVGGASLDAREFLELLRRIHIK